MDILYDDEDIVVINKFPGVVVHPGAGNYDKTIVNGLLYKYQNNLSAVGGKLRPGIVHRIDKDTSGLIVIAKNNATHENLSNQFSQHKIKRVYQLLVWGKLKPQTGIIKTLITRSTKNRQLMEVGITKGRRAITNYKTLEVFENNKTPTLSFIECRLETGRTHQIRVHLKYKGTSIIGDNRYGKKNIKFKKINKDFSKNLSKVNGQILHATTLGFVHPTKNKWLNFEAPLPTEFKKMLNLLNKLDG